jgi:hypothetical protein
MADQALVRRGMWLRVPDGVDDVTAAAVTNPGMAAWKTLMWEGELAAGQTVLVLARPEHPAGSPPSWPSATARASSPPGATSGSWSSSWPAERTPPSGSIAPVRSWPR